MPIDTHCHIDMFDDPIAIAKDYNNAHTRCVMTTMLPSHYELALPHLRPFRAIMPALGMHPLRVDEGMKEINKFVELAGSTEYIGEIGLDFFRGGENTKETQIALLRRILPEIRNSKFVTVHSRNAHREVANMLHEYDVKPVCFHYFIGGANAAEKLVARGHYFSINERMLKSKHRSMIGVLPRDRILVETDGPFLTKRPLEMITQIYEELSRIWKTEILETEELISSNFSKCRTIA